jgi:hypothetical protein
MAVCDLADIPSNVTNGALVQIFINWARQNPVEWSEVTLSGVTDAFAEAFPCAMVD